jgi:hypothetical protein
MSETNNLPTVAGDIALAGDGAGIASALQTLVAGLNHRSEAFDDINLTLHCESTADGASRSIFHTALTNIGVDVRQRGRRSSASLVALPNVEGKPPRLSPPAYLNAKERKLSIDLVASCDPRHFVESDVPLLTSFVQATLLSRSAARKPKDIAIWEKAVRAQATLATPLRLAPQARTDPKTIACQQPYRGPCPWEGLEDLDRNGNRRRDA